MVSAKVKNKIRSFSKSKKALSKDLSRDSLDYFLQPGDLIDIVAPGSACQDDVLQKAVVWIESQGFKARYPKDLFKPDVFLANSDEKRFQHLSAALRASDSKAVWCIRGGYGSIRLVPQLLKMKKLKEKLFIGLSDITTLHLFLNQKWGWTTLHASLLDRLGEKKLTKQNELELINSITGKRTELKFDQLNPLNISAEKKKVIKGRVLGGNMTVFCSALGTELQPNLSGCFLFLEDINERGYRVDRMLYQIEQARVLEGCRAIVFGDFIGGNEVNGENHVQKTIQEFCQRLKIPCFSGLQTGHGELQRPLFFNASAEIISDAQINLKVYSFKV